MAFWLIGTVVAVAVLYLVVMNVFLRTRLFRNLIAFSPQDMLIQYDSAYSWFPGRIHVDGLNIRGSDSAVEWELVLDHCDFHFWPLDVAKRRFHASHVRGDGLSFRLRLRLSEEDATPQLVDALPPVPGFSDPPYRLIGPPSAPLTDADYNLVTIQLDDVVADHVREIWMQSLRVTGDMRVTGSWFFRPLRMLKLDQGLVEADTLNAWYGRNHPMASNLRGRIDVTIHPFDLRVPKGLEILENFSIHPELVGVVNAASALENLIDLPDVAFIRGGGPLEVRARIDHGRIIAGSRIDALIADARAATTRLDLDSGVAMQLFAEEHGQETNLYGLVDFLKPSVTQSGRDVAHATKVSVRVTNPNADLGHFSTDDAAFGLDVDQALAPSLAPLHPMLLEKTTLDVESESVTADAHIVGRFRDSSAVGTLDLAVRNLSIAKERDHVTTNLQAALHLDGSLSEQRASLTGSSVVLRDVVAELHGVDLTAQRLAVVAKRASLEGHKPEDVELDVDLPRIDVRDLHQVGALLPKGTFSVRGGSGHAGARAAVSFAEKTVRGSLSMTLDPIDVRLGSMDVRGHVESSVERAVLDWGQTRVFLAGSRVTMSDASVGLRGGKDLLTAPSLDVRTEAVAFGAQGSSGTVAVELPRASYLDLPLLARTVGLPPTVRIEQGRAAATLSAKLDLKSLAATGEARIGTESLHLRVGTQDFASNVTATIEARQSATQPDVTNLSGTSLSFTSEDAHGGEPWWARVVTPEASLRLAGGAGLLAHVELEAKNALPAEALVADLTGVPRWLIETSPMGHLVANGTVRASPSLFEVRSMEAHGGGASVRVEYEKHDDEKQGAALVDVGAIHLGFKLAGTGPGFVLFGADSWFKKTLDAINLTRAEQQPASLGN